MKRILMAFIYFYIFLISLIVFLPKESIYNFVENELVKKDIIVSNEIRDEKFFGLDILNADIYFESLHIGKIENFSFSTFLFLTTINLENISILDSFSPFVPNKIKKVTLEYSIISFNKIKISSIDSFGNLKGEIDIFTKILKIKLIASDEMKNKYSNILKNMKFENGEYIYEYKF